MIKGYNCIAGVWESNENAKTFQTVNPGTKEILPTKFQEANTAQIEKAVLEAGQCATQFRQTSAAAKANFLIAIKSEIEERSVSILACYMQESGLPEGRAKGEMQRTLDQIDRFVELLREGSYVQATLNTSGSDLRKMLVSIGPIVVFGASNFPLAFSTAGGDTISALAAGCPVIIKAHPYHAGTSEWVARAIVSAAEKQELPKGVFSHLGGASHDVGSQLVTHSMVKGVGFTGSFAGGKALYNLAQNRKIPIPVFAEMGSINPIFILENKRHSDSNLALSIAQSITLGTGQFCTNPGLIVVYDTKHKKDFGNELLQHIKEMELPPMVHQSIQERYDAQIEDLKNCSAVKAMHFSPKCTAIIGVTSADKFLDTPSLSEEVFGPFTLVVECSNWEEIKAIALHLEGQLTATILGDEEDAKVMSILMPLLEEKVGRLLFKGLPTGVVVTKAMQHGGPFPATTDGRYTSVGTDAIYRWLRPVAYQDCPDNLLPEALQNNNPLKILRHVNGVMTMNVL